jgi:hypothetical protein
VIGDTGVPEPLLSAPPIRANMKVTAAVPAARLDQVSRVPCRYLTKGFIRHEVAQTGVSPALVL